jgi:hypothetical protein
MERFEGSGLSISAFCREAKLSRSSFVKWRRRLAAAESAPASSFVEWVAPSAPEAEPRRDAGEFELALPGGVVLRWRT